MTTRRQRPISLKTTDRSMLDAQKRRYELSTGQKTEWGTFLGTMVLLGLAAAGVYGRARARHQSAQSVDVECCECGGPFLMAVPAGTGRAVQVTCPHCGSELVVDLGASQ